MTDQLRECPFCGGEAALIEGEFGTDIEHAACCPSCDFHISPSVNDDDVLEKWEAEGKWDERAREFVSKAWNTRQEAGELVWEEESPFFSEAKTPMGTYEIFHAWKALRFVHSAELNGEEIARHETPEEAKSACQAHYNKTKQEM